MTGQHPEWSWVLGCLHPLLLLPWGYIGVVIFFVARLVTVVEPHQARLHWLYTVSQDWIREV